MKDQMVEKTLKVKEGVDTGKFTSVEAACKVFKISPASYYNYKKEIVAEELPNKPTTKEDWIKEVESLRRENSYLREKLKEDFSKMQKMEKKILSFVLQDVQ